MAGQQNEQKFQNKIFIVQILEIPSKGNIFCYIDWDWYLYAEYVLLCIREVIIF